MLGSVPEEVYWLLWGAAGLSVAWVLLPKVLAALGQTRCAVAVVGGADALRPTGDDPQYDYLFDTLAGLGFAPLGAKVESSWFLPHGWRRVGLPGRVFATADRDCFASLYRLYDADPWHLAFCTVFTDDSLVMTSDHMADFRVDQDGYLRWGCPSSDLAEVLKQHRRTAEDYRTAGGRTVDHPGLEGISEAIRYHSERFLRRRGPALAAKGLVDAVFFLVGPAAFAGLWLGLDHWAVPAMVILGGVAHTALRPLALRLGMQKFRRRDAERGLEMQWARRREARRAPQPPAAPTSDGITTPGQFPENEDRYTPKSPP